MMNEVLNYVDFIKSQNRNGIFSHPDVQQRMLMMMGEEKNQKLELSKDEEKKIAQNYAVMFFALATMRWCRGETLGVARQKALEQMNSFVKNKTNVAHPMNKYLIAINNQYHRFVSQLNMTDKNSDKKIEVSSDLAAKLSEEAIKKFKEALKLLNEMYKKYMPEKDIKKQPATVKFDLAKQNAQKMLQYWMLKQKERQRAA